MKDKAEIEQDIAIAKDAINKANEEAAKARLGLITLQRELKQTNRALGLTDEGRPRAKRGRKGQEQVSSADPRQKSIADIPGAIADPADQSEGQHGRSNPHRPAR